MIRMLPLRLMTLHFSHIGFTEDLTFMSILLSGGLLPRKHTVYPWAHRPPAGYSGAGRAEIQIALYQSRLQGASVIYRAR